jgi:hypothetical protein
MSHVLKGAYQARIQQALDKIDRLNKELLTTTNMSNILKIQEKIEELKYFSETWKDLYEQQLLEIKQGAKGFRAVSLPITTSSKTSANALQTQLNMGRIYTEENSIMSQIKKRKPYERTIAENNTQQYNTEPNLTQDDLTSELAKLREALTLDLQELQSAKTEVYNGSNQSVGAKRSKMGGSYSKKKRKNKRKTKKHK